MVSIVVRRCVCNGGVESAIHLDVAHASSDFEARSVASEPAGYVFHSDCLPDLSVAARRLSDRALWPTLAPCSRRRIDGLELDIDQQRVIADAGVSKLWRARRNRRGDHRRRHDRLDGALVPRSPRARNRHRDGGLRHGRDVDHVSDRHEPRKVRLSAHADRLRRDSRRGRHRRRAGNEIAAARIHGELAAADRFTSRAPT